MGKCRFIYDNFITAESMITVSSLRSGMVTAALKAGTGSAILSVGGNYSGTTDLEYIVEIDSIAGGAEVGQATFKWSDGSGGWNASGVTTSASLTLLNNGVYIAFASGTGADFVVGDKWYFKGINLFNAGKMLDLDRDSRYRSAALGAPNTIILDLGEEQEVDTIVLQDHNLTSAVTISVDADSAATFDSGIAGAPEFSENMTWYTEKIIHYLTAAQTYRHWKINITDAANPDGYIEIGELLVGEYMELSRTFNRTPSRPQELIYTRQETSAGIRRHRYYNARRNLNYNFRFLTAGDMALLEAMMAALNDKSAGTMKPFWFNEDSGSPSNSWLVNMYNLNREFSEASGFYHCPMELEEVIAND